LNQIKRIILGVLAWLAAITGLHVWLNVDYRAVMNDYLPKEKRKIHIAYIPVT